MLDFLMWLLLTIMIGFICFSIHPILWWFYVIAIVIAILK